MMGNESIFHNIVGNPSQQEIEGIVKSGRIPTKNKDPEEKEYILILKSANFKLRSSFFEDYDYDVEMDGEAFIRIGRKEIFKLIIEVFENAGTDLDIDVEKSIVMVEGVPIEKAVSLYRFVQLCNQKYPDMKIDIDEFLLDYESSDDSNNTATGFGGNAGTILNSNETEE